MAKWPNHFISGKQFQKRPNGNPGPALIHKGRNSLKWEGVKDFVTAVLELRNVRIEVGVKMIQNCVTSFMFDPKTKTTATAYLKYQKLKQSVLRGVVEDTVLKCNM